MAVERRQLRFDSFAEVKADAVRLLEKGYTKVGNWDLSQCCGHLAEWMRFPIDGFPKAPAPIAAILWMMKKTVGRKKFEQYIRERSFPAGKPTMPATVMKPGGDDKAAVELLKAAVDRLEAHAGFVHPSPLFGALTKDEAAKMQLVHAAHHLSFLVPNAG